MGIRDLTKDQVSVIVQRYLNGDSAKDISEDLGLIRHQVYYTVYYLRSLGADIPRRRRSTRETIRQFYEEHKRSLNGS